jgi:hypothetical protein
MVFSLGINELIRRKNKVDDCFEFEPLGVGCQGEGNILRATKDYLLLPDSNRPASCAPTDFRIAAFSRLAGRSAEKSLPG